MNGRSKSMSCSSMLYLTKSAVPGCYTSQTNARAFRKTQSLVLRSAASQHGLTTAQKDSCGLELRRKSASPANETIFVAVLNEQKRQVQKQFYACHYSQLFAAALCDGRSRFLDQLCKCFRLLKRTAVTIDYQHLKLVVKPQATQTATSLFAQFQSVKSATAVQVEELIALEKNAYRIVFGGLEEYNQILFVKWVSNPAFYTVYRHPAIQIFQNMLNQKLIGQFNYVNRNPEFLNGIMRTLDRLTTGKEHFRYPFQK